MSTELVVKNEQANDQTMSKAELLASVGVMQDDGKSLVVQLKNHFRSKGLKGDKLTETVNDILTGKGADYISVRESQALSAGFLRDIKDFAPLKDGRRKFTVTYFEAPKPKQKPITMTESQVADFKVQYNLTEEAFLAIEKLGWIKREVPPVRDIETVNLATV